jgi:dTDP-4-dehydrorhamnose reductase
MSTYLVTGAAGQLGSTFVRRLTGRGARVVPVDREEADLTDHQRVREIVADLRPDVVINCAAYNDVEGAEDQPAEAFAVNAFAVRTLARAAHDSGAVLVHYSTDFVFDGTASSPYAETDRPAPQSVYAQSKLVGEWFAADVARHYVLRVESLFGGPAAKSSIDRIIDALRSGREARVFADRVVSPSYVEDVVTVTEALLDTAAPAGVYHCVNSGHATWLEVGREIAVALGAPERLLQPVSVADVVLRARRPVFAALSNEKLRRLGIAMPSWQEAVRRYVALTPGRAL